MKKVALTDFAKYRYPSALELSPDGRYLTFALKEVDREGDGYRWNLWLYDLESRESRQITRGDDQRQAVHRFGDVAQGVEHLVRRGQFGGLGG